MTNAEKYLKDNIKENDFADMCVYLTRYFDNKISMQKVADFFKEQAKPTLTEDERVILKNIPMNFMLYRNFAGGLLLRDKDKVVHYEFYMYDHLFKFIKRRRRIRDKGVAR